MSANNPTSLLGVITSVAFLIGIALMFASLFYRRGDAPMIGSTDPQDKAPIWRQRDRYRGPGFALLTSGFVLWTISTLALSVSWMAGCPIFR